MTEWYPLYLEWLADHPWAKRVSWTCEHAPRTPLQTHLRHIPTPAQKRHQTMRPRIWGISEGWREQWR